MAQLERMDAHLDTLIIELYQANTCVSHIARWQARLGSFVESSSPSPEASKDEDYDGDFDDDDDDEEEDVGSSGDDEMTT